MAIDPSSEYGAQVDTSSDPTGYPLGQAQNITVAGDGTGTPLEKKWLSDLWGFLQAILNGATPSGTPDKVGASQYLDGLDTRYGGPFSRGVAPALNWTYTTAVTSPDRAIHNPANGSTWICKTGGGVTEWTPSELGTALTVGGSDSFEPCVRKDTNGLASVVFIGSETNGLQARYGTASDPETFGTATLNSPSTASVTCLGCAYDDVNETVVGMAYSATAGDRFFFHFDDSGTSLLAATTAPSLPQQNSVAIVNAGVKCAAGGGRAIVLYETTDTGPVYAFKCYTSTDGGDTWAETGAPPGTDQDVIVGGVYYVANFNRLGPKFVAVTRTNGAAQVHHSTDGAVWTALTVPSILDKIVGTDDTDSFSAVVVGNSIFFNTQDSTDGFHRNVFVWNVEQDKVVILKPVQGNSTSAAPTKMFFDGVRLFLSYGTTGFLYSDPIAAPDSHLLASIE